MYDGWTIEDIQEESRDFYRSPVYQFWESTKNYRDTGEKVGFVSFQEEISPPEENVENGEQDGGVDGQAGDDGGEREESLGGEITPSARRVLSFASSFAL